MKTLLVAMLLTASPLDNADLDTLDGFITEYGKTECHVDKTFDMEAQEIDGEMYSVRCKGGKDYIITVLSDGRIGIVSCEEAKTVGAVCWKTFAEQEKEKKQ